MTSCADSKTRGEEAEAGGSAASELGETEGRKGRNEQGMATEVRRERRREMNAKGGKQGQYTEQGTSRSS